MLGNKLVKDFKNLQIEIEDYLIENVSDIVAEFADRKGQEHYNLINELCDSFKKTMSKMATFESFNINMIDYDTKLIALNAKIVEQDKYFDISGDFNDEVATIAADLTKNKMLYLLSIIDVSKELGLSKTTNILNFKLKILFDRIKYILNEAIDGTTYTYEGEAEKLISPIRLIVAEKVALYNSFSIKEPLDVALKAQYKKILDYKEIDRIIKTSGFKPIRQNGSHKIYSNFEGESIPVPQHSLGKGLSCKIQKQILQKKL
ncbi:type II toxin-antitoxin system HicA family toxin [Clostridium sp.]|uniref:type II toxin-antitoxin system HicA family toxin n=1 Tax=Clostridium sp. TaxID=1506 RepID=UPI001A3FB51F|nr:type II toxin-antitoxin system HicA family toxin [Clostridium sp.]MBK5236385.1 type II toxin-antitoxin system HicA family toxin [Clostridium sp.]